MYMKKAVPEDRNYNQGFEIIDLGSEQTSTVMSYASTKLEEEKIPSSRSQSLKE